MIGLSELDAVNIVLLAAAEAPVHSLADANNQGLSQAALAQDILSNELRQLQSRGWSWNTDCDISLTPDANNHFPIPGDSLLVELNVEGTRSNVIVRNGLLYDRNKQTYKLGVNSYRVLKIVYELPYDEVPYPAQYLAAWEAAVTYTGSYLGTNTPSYVNAVVKRDSANEALMLDEHRRMPRNMHPHNSPSRFSYSRY